MRKGNLTTLTLFTTSGHLYRKHFSDKSPPSKIFISSPVIMIYYLNKNRVQMERKARYKEVRFLADPGEARGVSSNTVGIN